MMRGLLVSASPTSASLECEQQDVSMRFVDPVGRRSSHLNPRRISDTPHLPQDAPTSRQTGRVDEKTVKHVDGKFSFPSGLAENTHRMPAPSLAIAGEMPC